MARAADEVWIRVLLTLVAALCPAAAAGEEVFAELAGSGLDFVQVNGRAGDYHLPEITCGAGALLDYDSDGDLDLYLLQGQRLDGTVDPALTDRLYRNDLQARRDGGVLPRFVDVTEGSGVRETGYGCGVAVGDYDNDGDPDLYLAQFGPNRLLENLGDGTFADVTRESGADDPRWSVAAAFADLDGDGWLDLYVGNYLDYSLARAKVCRTAAGARDYCNPDAYRGVPDRLLASRGPGPDGRVTFADATLAAGLLGQRSKSLGVVAGDFDGDGRTDLYVANDGVANQLWLQRSPGRFRDEALLAGCAVDGQGRAQAGMGVVAADLDGDGDEDLFLTHLTGETNTFYRNDGRGTFRDASAESGLAAPSWPFTSWGIGCLDYDGDGWLDLAVVNGAVRTLEALASAGDPYPFHQENQLFRNLGGGRFAEDTARAGGGFHRSEVSRGLAVGDLDHDGDGDLLLVNARGPARVLLNRLGQDRPWLGLRLLAGGFGRDAQGARVEIRRRSGPALWRTVRTHGGYGAAHDPRLQVGLGEGGEVAAVRVRWPDGRVEEWADLPAGRYAVLYQDGGRGGR